MFEAAPLSDKEFSQFQHFIYETAGITLPSTKKPLVSGRLAKRLQARGLGSYGDYFALLSSGKAADEVQTAIDLLTTNETYFFRDMQHFDLLRQLAMQARGRSDEFRVWSAASSTGEEAFSIAMVLADTLGMGAWSVLGTDISTRVLQVAGQAHYTLARARHIPQDYLKRYCLRGVGPQEGTLLISRALRARVQFRHANLNAPLPELGRFDVVFLRNVMIYFNDDTKRQVVARAAAALRPGGHFFIGHSESLNGLSAGLEMTAPSIYRKP
jgi:chemotaxis protein methyltransferase CheR